jgi:hypothetical protein
MILVHQMKKWRPVEGRMGRRRRVSFVKTIDTYSGPVV